MDYTNSDTHNAIRIFKIYKNMPKEMKNELSLLITPENILGLESHWITEDTHTLFNKTMNNFNSMTINEAMDRYDGKEYWTDITKFERLIKQIKIYLQLRPNLLEDYPELLI